MVANKRTHVSKLQPKGTTMIFVGYLLNHPSGTYEFYNATNDSIVTSNLVKWSNFIQWDAYSDDTPAGNLFVDTKDAASLSDNEDDFIITKDNESISQQKIHMSQESVLADLMDSDKYTDLPDLPESTGVITRSKARTLGEATSHQILVPTTIKRELKNLQTSPTYKVTGNTVPTKVFDQPPIVNAIFTDDIHFQFLPVGGMGDEDSGSESLSD